MVQANPGQTLTNQTTAVAGTSIDIMGAATGVAGTCYASLVVTVTGMTVSSGSPFAVVGLEVSLDGSSWARVSECHAAANGVTICSNADPIPFRFARGTLDALDSRITAITVNAFVAGSA